MFTGIDILEKMHLQDIVLSPDFANFIRWFGELNRSNYLSVDEIAKVNELTANGSFNDDLEGVTKIIEQTVGQSLDDVDKVEELQEDLDGLKYSEKEYEDMLSMANGTDLKIDTEMNRLNSVNHSSELKMDSLIESCKEGAEMLEELRVKNIENRNNLFTSFSGQHSPPLRWCRLDLDGYSIDSDNSALALKLRFEEKLKLMNFVDVDNQNLKRLYNLQNLESIFIRNASAQFDTECDSKKIEILIDILSKPFQPMSFQLMGEQIERLTWQNEEIEETIENLESTINEKITHLAYQEAKFCEVENNTEKLRAAEKRLEILNQVSKPISDNLLLADALWLSLHAEMETMKNILQDISPGHYEEENRQCARNLEILTRISENSSVDLVAQEFSTKISEVMAEDDSPDSVESEDSSSPAAKFAAATNKNKMQLQDVISDSYQTMIVNSIKHFNEVSARMNAFIGNGPSNRPNIWNLPILADMEVHRRKFDLMFDSSREMRHNFMKKYHQPFVNDELWKRRQLLWIWFLTDQEAFFEAFRQTAGDAKNINSHKRMSIVGGMKRQQ